MTAKRIASREDAAKFTNNLINVENQLMTEKGNRWHFGRQELRAVLDFIYGGAPKCEREQITKDKR